MAFKRLVFPAIASLAYAESTITSMFFIDPRASLQASIVGNDATATTYALNCPKDIEPISCGVESVASMRYIANGDEVTIVDAFEEMSTVSESLTCSLDGTASAVCSWMSGGAMESATTHDIRLSPVTVTAGTVTGAASASTTSEDSGPEETGSEAATATPTGGVNKVQGDVGIVFGGVVGVVGLVGVVLM